MFFVWVFCVYVFSSFYTGEVKQLFSRIYISCLCVVAVVVVIVVR